MTFKVKTKAIVKFAGFEYQATFSQPAFDSVAEYCNLVYRALKIWNITEQNIKVSSGGLSLTEPFMTIQLARKFALNLTRIGFTVVAENVDWAEAPLIIDLVESCKRAAAQFFGETLTKQQGQLYMQVVPNEFSIRQLTRQMVPELPSPFGEQWDCLGVNLHGERTMVVVDKSALHENGLFLRILRRFDSTVDARLIASDIKTCEDWLCEILGLEFD